MTILILSVRNRSIQRSKELVLLESETKDEVTILRAGLDISEKRLILRYTDIGNWKMEYKYRQKFTKQFRIKYVHVIKNDKLDSMRVRDRILTIKCDHASYNQSSNMK